MLGLKLETVSKTRCFCDHDEGLFAGVSILLGNLENIKLARC